MSAHLNTRLRDIETLIEKHYVPKAHELNQHVLEVEAEMANSEHRIDAAIRAAKDDEQRHLGVLRDKLKRFERELVELATEREPLDAERADLAEFLGRDR